MDFLVRFLLSEPVKLAEKVAMNIFGNQFLQIMFRKRIPEHIESLLTKCINPFVLRLSADIYGCRVIQEIIHSLQISRELKVELVFNLRAQIASHRQYRFVRDLVTSINGNHVVQAVLKLRLPAEDVDFVKAELERDLVFYCGHMSACRVIQVYLRNYGDQLDLAPLLKDNTHIKLAEMEYGNHVIQCILKQSCFWNVQRRVISQMFEEHNVLRLSKGKQGSHVIESCIRVASPRQIESLVRCVCANRGRLLKSMAVDGFGNYVLRTLFDRCSPRLKELITDSVMYYLDSMFHQRMHDQTEFIYKVYRHYKGGAGGGRRVRA